MVRSIGAATWNLEHEGACRVFTAFRVMMRYFTQEIPSKYMLPGTETAYIEQKEWVFRQLESQCSNVKIAITNVIQFAVPIISEIPILEMPWIALVETMDLRLQEVFKTISIYKDLDVRERQALVSECDQLRRDVVRSEEQHRMERSARLATEELLQIEKQLRQKDAEAVKSRRLWEEVTRKFQEECLQRRMQESKEQVCSQEHYTNVPRLDPDGQRRAVAQQEGQQQQADKDRVLAQKAQELKEKAKELEAKEKSLRQKEKEIAKKVKECRTEHQTSEERSAWRHYEAMWDVMTAPKLSFKTMPWPVVMQPTSPSEITTQTIHRFLFSTAIDNAVSLPPNSKTNSLIPKPISRREHVKKAQLRWHPDKFSRMLARVKDEDKLAVEEAAGLVSRALNTLLAESK